MVSFYLSFRSILIKEIVEDEGALWTKGIILWLSINIYSLKDKRLQVADYAIVFVSEY